MNLTNKKSFLKLVMEVPFCPEESMDALAKIKKQLGKDMWPLLSQSWGRQPSSPDLDESSQPSLGPKHK